MKAGWEVKTLEEVCEYENGKAHEQCIDENGKYIVVNSKFISSDGRVFKKSNEALLKLKINDIAIVLSDVPNGKALAKCFLVDEEDKYTLNQRIGLIRSKKFDVKFLYYQLNRNKHFLAFDNGGNQTNMRLNQMLSCPLLIPPLPEQQRIVALLDAAFASIATAKANTEQNLKNARALFDSYLHEVFSKRGEGWEEKTLNEVCDLITCGVAATPKYVDENEGIPFLSAQNVRDGEVVLDKYRYISKELHQELTKKNKPEKGDILYSRVGSKFGEAGVVEHEFEFSVYVSVTLIKPTKNKLDSYFLKHYLNSSFVKSLALKSINSSGVPNLNVKDVRGFPIKYPSISEQKEIVNQINLLRKETQHLETLYQRKLQALDELKKSLLHKAFNGEL